MANMFVHFEPIRANGGGGEEPTSSSTTTADEELPVYVVPGTFYDSLVFQTHQQPTNKPLVHPVVVVASIFLTHFCGRYMVVVLCGICVCISKIG